MYKTRFIKKFLILLLVFSSVFINVSCDKKVYEVNEDNITHTVTLQTDNWTKTVTVKNGEFYKFPDPKKEHYILSGWTNGEKTFESSGIWTLPTDETLVPIWSPKKFIITYDYNINGYEKYGEYTIEDTVVLENPFVASYMFVGWTGENIENMTKIVSIKEGSYGNKKYVANWLKIEFYGFQYRIVGDEAVVVGYYPYLEKQPVDEILSEVEYEGKKYPVTKITEEAFANMGAFTNRLIIPESISYIEKNAFYACDDLEIMLPYGADLEKWAESVVIEEGNKDVKDVILGIRPKIGWSPYV